jgi:hypothetical protein
MRITSTVSSVRRASAIGLTLTLSVLNKGASLAHSQPRGRHSWRSDPALKGE